MTEVVTLDHRPRGIGGRIRSNVYRLLGVSPDGTLKVYGPPVADARHDRFIRDPKRRCGTFNVRPDQIVTRTPVEVEGGAA